MKIKVIARTEQLTKHLKDIQRKQIPFATKNALNDVAFDSKRFIQKAMVHYLDRPTGDITSGKGKMIGSVQVDKAKKSQLIATVGFAGLGFGRTTWAEQPAEIMKRHIQGGTRYARGKELRIPSDTKGRGIKLNKHGNIAGKKNKIAKMIGNKDQFFEGIPKGDYSQADRGIWERTPRNSKRAKGTKAKKWKATAKIVQRIAYEPFTKYRKRFPSLNVLVGKVVNNNYKKRFNSALNKALASAK